MFIADETRKIRVKLGGAVATSELSISGFWAQMTTAGVLDAASAIHAVTTGTTPVDIVASPAAGKIRPIKGLAIQNKDTAAVTLIIEQYDGSNARELWKSVLSVGDILVYGGDGLPQQYDSTGAMKTAGTGGGGAGFSDAEGDPADVTSAAADGVSSYAARRDHAHTIAADTVTNAMSADMAAATVKGRAAGAGTGDPTDLTAAQLVAIIATADGSGSGLDADLLDGQSSAAFAASSHTHPIADLTDDGALAALNTVGTAQIDNDSVTYAKIQNVSATDRLLGRDTAAAGDVEELTVGGGIEFTGTGGIQRSALTGDVTASAGSGSTTIANDAVTYAKMQNVSATDRLLGRDTAAAGDVEELTVGGGLEFSGAGGIQRSALTGDVTASAASNATTIANDAVTNAKLANVATQTIKGRVTASTGDPEDLTATQAAGIISENAQMILASQVFG